MGRGYIVATSSEAWEAAQKSLCIYGHALWGHANITVPMGSYPAVIYPSQCVLCRFTEDGKEFVCLSFRLAGLPCPACNVHVRLV